MIPPDFIDTAIFRSSCHTIPAEEKWKTPALKRKKRYSNRRSGVEQQVWDVLIVGGGPAGYAAALYCARAGLSALVLESTAIGGQLSTTEEVDNYPGIAETVIGIELAGQMQQGAARFGAETRFAQVTALELGGLLKKAKTADSTLTGRTVIYAAGAGPRTLDVPGETDLRGKGVSYCAACDGAFFRGKTVAVLGGGNSAAAEALTLARLCKRVYLLHRRDTMRAEKSYLQALEQTPNLTFCWNARIEKILGEQMVTGILYRDLILGQTQALSCDGVFVAIGRKPSTELLTGQVTLDTHGYILADETTRTNLPGVFAAGDVRAKPLRQIVTAAADGAVAAHFAEEYLAGLRIS